MRNLHLRVFLSLFLVCLLFSAQAHAAATKQYVVVDKIAPVFESLSKAKNPPKGGWKILDCNMEIEMPVVYGDVLEGVPASKKGWILLKSEGRDLGYVQESALVPFPEHKSRKGSPFQVVKDKVVPHILPNKYPLSTFDKFSLPYGAVVTVSGETTIGGKRWLLCFFGSDYFAESPVDGACVMGSDKRSGWIPADTAVELATTKPDLSKVEEGKLPQKLKGAARAAVLKNGFYVAPEPVFVKELTEDDMVNAYIEMAPLTPRIITADLPLHAFHLYFDRMLQKVEEKVMMQRESKLIAGMRSEFSKLRPELESTAFGKETAALVDDYLAVAANLLGGSSKLSGRAAEFAALAGKGSGSALSPFTMAPQDFTLFQPRGHYTLNNGLKTYFRATYFLGTPFPLEKDPGAAAAFVLCRILSAPAVKALWNSLYDPVKYLVGSSNVNSCIDLAPVAAKFKLGDIGDPAKMKEIKIAIDKAAKESVIQKQPGKKFSILPRRITFDAMVFDSLTELKTSGGKVRTIPDPLDVMAVLGSPVAAKEVKKYEEFIKYGENVEMMKKRWSEYVASAAGDNVYTSWLSFVKTYLSPTTSKQLFARSAAWSYKKLMTAEASVAELKHDTILYAEQSGAEMGDGGDFDAAPYEQPIARGYVEPAADLYRAMAKSALKITKFLGQMFPGQKSEYYKSNLEGFAEMMEKLADISKRAETDTMTYGDYLDIRDFRLPSVLPEGIGDIFEEKTRDMLKMALVADVATDNITGNALYMGTGTPRKIQVYVNDRSGGFRLTEGYVYSYYSFVKSLSEGRMDDDRWKKIVYDPKKQGELKKYQPDWIEKINK